MSPLRIAKPRYLAYVALELGLIVAIMAGLAQMTLRWIPAGGTGGQTFVIAGLSALFCLALLSTQWANLGDDGSPLREIVVFFVVSLVLGVLCFAGIWLLADAEHRRFPAVLTAESLVAVPLTIGLWRLISRRLNLLGALRDKVLILGTDETAKQVCRWVVGNHGAEYGVVGFADEHRGREGEVLTMGVRIQTEYESLSTFCPGRVDRVLVALDEKRGRLPVRQLMEVRLLGIEIEEATSFFERTAGKIAVETMLPSWLIYSEGFKTTRLRMILKRAADIALSVPLLLLTAPLMALTAILIKLDSRGPVLYRQTRLGRDRRPYQVLKFRSMRQGAESQSGPTWAAKRDPRITRIGGILRRTRVDELPQLLNVLRGEMSFVGPRPEREHFVTQLERTIPYFGLRMIVRPGVTGWAQVKYPYGASEEDAREKLKYDLYYIKNSNLLLDLWIVLMTINVVLFGKGAR